jgi:hypothetical protein
MTRLFTWLSFVVVVSIAAPPPAHADDARDASTRAALQSFDEGRKALEAGDHARALEAFSASHQLLPSPNSLLYMARCQRALGRIASAFTTFRLAYKQAQDRLVATGDSRYTATRDTAAREAASIEADVPKLALMVPAGAPQTLVVTVNGAVAPASMWGTAIDTDPGRITIDAQGPRLAPFHEELVLAPGETRRVDVVLARVPTAGLVLRLASKPAGYALRVDGVALDASEVSTVREVDPGPHVVEATAPGHRPLRLERTLANGETATVDVRWDADGGDGRPGRAATPRWLFVTSLAVAVASTSTGAILAIDANGRASDEEAKDPLLRDLRERDRIRSEANVANGFLVAGAVFAAGAAVLVFTTDGKKAPNARAPERSTAAGVRRFWLGASGASMAAGGAF